MSGDECEATDCHAPAAIEIQMRFDIRVLAAAEPELAEKLASAAPTRTAVRFCVPCMWLMYGPMMDIQGIPELYERIQANEVVEQ